MNLKQARAKLDSVSKSTATKHPKVLVAELCVVVKFLLNELDRIKSPVISLLSERLPEDFKLNPHKPMGPPPLPQQPVSDPPQRSRPINPPHSYRKGNAGDAM